MPDINESDVSIEKLNITLPPTVVRDLIGKTAIYVNKNGAVFENKIRTKESKNPKFIFLNDNDPYNEYYKYCLSFLKENGRLPEINQDLKSHQEVNDTKTDELLDNVTDFQKSIVTLETPKPFNFISIQNDKLDFPEDFISAADLKIIKLIAQFAVVNGEDVMNDFKQHALDQNNGLFLQFQFLNEAHSMHPIYKKFFNQYSLLWNKKDELLESFETLTSDGHIDKLQFLTKCFKKAEYFNKESMNLQDVKNKKLEERLKYNSIDWLNFEVVETIEFTKLDEIAELHKPLIKSDLEYRSLVQKGTSSLFDEVDVNINGGYDSDADHIVDAEEEGENDDDTVPQYQEEEDNTGKSDEEAVEEVAKTKVPKGMKIKAAGESRLKRKFHQVANGSSNVDSATKEKLLECPITKELIPESKFQNHINKLLRDPKYEEEKTRYESKFKYGSNLSTEQVYQNIQDLFSTTNNYVKRSKN